MTSHWETGAHNMFSTIATPSNYLQMLTSQNAGSPHLLVGGRSHYKNPVLNPNIKHCLAHFTAVCWAFTTNIPDCCKSLHVGLDDFQQLVKFSSLLSIIFDSNLQPFLSSLRLNLKYFYKTYLCEGMRLKSIMWTISVNQLGRIISIQFNC